jgi:hypothetical protein
MRKLFKNNVCIIIIKMSSSRSIAAARARRANEPAPPVSGNRPGTSINSHAAFAPQPQMQQFKQPSPNVRVAKSQQPQMQQQQPQTSPLPFTKLSISDAIGLITLRLGRVEEYIIEAQHNEEIREQNGENGSYNLPENSKIIDNSVFTNIISRLDSIEKKNFEVNNNDLTQINEDVSNLSNEFTKYNSILTQSNEKLFKMERDLVESKDTLKTLLLRFNSYMEETNNKLSDYELAIAEIETNIPIYNNKEHSNENNVETVELDNESNEDENIDNNLKSIMTVDLKNIIKQELANDTTI